MEKRESKENIVKTKLIGELLQELKEKGIDISRDYYYREPAFEKMEQETVVDIDITISKAWFIEKNIVGQERLKKIYGKYAFGVEHIFSSKELSDDRWIPELVDALRDDECDEYAIRRYLYRRKKGLVYRLQKLGIDIEKFSDNGEKVKLLFFLTLFEKSEGVELLPFLANPTLENVDNSVVGGFTKNGELISKIKRNIEKEISHRYIKEARGILADIALQWQKVMEFVLFQLDVDESNIKELERMYYQLQFIQSMFHGQIIRLYKDSLLESFYLKILEHESIGREKDIMDIQEICQKEINNPEAKWIDRYKGITTCTLEEKNLRAYIKDNRKQLAALVFRKDQITSNDYKKFDAATDKINFYLEILENNTKWRKRNGIPVLVVISCIQEIVELNKKKKIDNRFYRYQSGDLKTLNSELYEGRNAHQKNQIAWVEKIRSRYNSNLGKGEENRLVYEIMTSLDFLIMKIYRSDSLEDMQILHSYLMMLVNAVIMNTDKKIKEFTEVAFEKSIGYRIIADTDIRQYFVGILGRASFFGSLAEQVGKFIKNTERAGCVQEKYWPFEITTMPYLDVLDGEVCFKIDPVQRILILNWIKIIPSEKIRLILYQAGCTVGFRLE